MLHQSTSEERQGNENMFAVTPYFAKREVFETQPGGKMKKSMDPCRVIGIDKDEDGELSYIIEYASNGATFLDRESYIVKCEPGNPL